MPETAVRLPRARTHTSPEWAQVLRTYYAKSFDTASEDSFVDSVEAFCSLSPDEQAFHQAHLAFRQVQALGDIYGCLRRIEAGLPALDTGALGALRHLPGIRKALVVIAKGQEELLDVLESGGGAGGSAGDESDDAEDDESELAEAIDGDDLEEDEEHFPDDDARAIDPEVLPVGASRPVELP